MNTENLIPISYVKQFTPLVVGDELFYKDGGYKFTLKSKVNAALYNNNDTVDKYYSLVSFADRPNTTGKQPVDDDVVVDMSKTLGGPRAASELRWARIGIIPTWKPNHEAMLAKFKEQGANTMNEQEHKAKSHEVALMTNALDDNPDEQVKEPESMIGPSEFYQKGGDEQIIEPYVADHLKGLINPVSEGCQAGAEQLKAGVEIGCCTNPKDFGIKLEDFGVNADTYHKLPHAINATPGKPVFTQEMADAGDRPKAMMECLVFNTLLVSPKYEKAVIDFIGEWCCVYTSESCRERSASVDDLLFKPIDNRSDGQKIREKLAGLVSGYVSAGEECDIQHYVDELMQSFSITLNKE